MQLTNEQIQLICRQLSPARAAFITTLLNTGMEKYKCGLDEMEEFIANLAHESGEFSLKCEGLYYSNASRIAAVWPSRFATKGAAGKKDASLFVKNPRKLANDVYNGRMGNRPGTDDGFNFKGGGFAQITGRDAYTLYTKFVNQRDGSKLTIEQVAELVQTKDEWAMDSAFWFFCEYKNLEQTAINDKFLELVKKWNGGYIGISSRQEYYSRAVEALKLKTA